MITISAVTSLDQPQATDPNEIKFLLSEAHTDFTVMVGKNKLILDKNPEQLIF